MSISTTIKIFRHLDQLFPPEIVDIIIEYYENYYFNSAETHYFELVGDYLSEIKEKTLSTKEKEQFFKHLGKKVSDYGLIDMLRPEIPPSLLHGARVPGETHLLELPDKPQ